MAALPALLALPAPFLRKVCEKKESRISRITLALGLGIGLGLRLKWPKKSWGHGKFCGHYNFAYDLAYDLP